MLIGVGWGLVGPLARGEDGLTLEQHLQRAETVLQQAQTQSVAASKNAWQIVEAAKALEQSGDTARAAEFYRMSLQLHPWNLEAQLRYGLALRTLGQPEKAREPFELVKRHAETDDWHNAARKALGEAPLKPAARWEGSEEGPYLLLVRIGKVPEVVLQETVEKLEARLGLPARVYEEMLVPPQASRSAFDRWMEHQVIASIQWQHPGARGLLAQLGVSRPQQAPKNELLAALIRALESEGDQERAQGMRAAAEHHRKWDAQWEAETMCDLAPRLLTEQKVKLGEAIIVGVTTCDLYSADSNYLFGTASTGQRRCVVSLQRYTAEFNGEPPDRARLVSRLHKQLLSSIGFALNVPRPTDPTSARAYPGSLQEHDAKSEYLSAECLAGFEQALGRKLPAAARKPSGL